MDVKSCTLSLNIIWLYDAIACFFNFGLWDCQKQTNNLVHTYLEIYSYQASI